MHLFSFGLPRQHRICVGINLEFKMELNIANCVKRLKLLFKFMNLEEIRVCRVVYYYHKGIFIVGPYKQCQPFLVFYKTTLHLSLFLAVSLPFTANIWSTFLSRFLFDLASNTRFVNRTSLHRHLTKSSGLPLSLQSLRYVCHSPKNSTSVFD